MWVTHHVLYDTFYKGLFKLCSYPYFSKSRLHLIKRSIWSGGGNRRHGGKVSSTIPWQVQRKLGDPECTQALHKGLAGLPGFWKQIKQSSYFQNLVLHYKSIFLIDFASGFLPFWRQLLQGNFCFKGTQYDQISHSIKHHILCISDSKLFAPLWML